MADKTSRKSSQRTRLNINKELSTDTNLATTSASISQDTSSTRKKRKSSNSSSKEPVTTSSFASKSTNNKLSKSASSLVNLTTHHHLKKEEEEEDESEQESDDEDEQETINVKLVRKNKKRKHNTIDSIEANKSNETQRNAKSKAIEALKSKLTPSSSNTTTQRGSEESDLLSKENKVSRSTSSQNLIDLVGESDEGETNTTSGELNSKIQTNSESSSDNDDDQSSNKKQKSSKSSKRRRLSSSDKVNKKLTRRRKSSRNKSQEEEQDTVEPILIDEEEESEEENIIRIDREDDEEEQEDLYKTRLRRPSSSKSASSNQSDKKHKSSKKSNKSQSSSLSETESINFKYQQQSKKETGACTSKPTSSTSTSSQHLASSGSRRGAAQAAHTTVTSLTDNTDNTAVATTASSSTAAAAATNNLHTDEAASTSKRSTSSQLIDLSVPTLTNSSLLAKFKSKPIMSQDNQKNTNTSSKQASKSTGSSSLTNNSASLSGAVASSSSGAATPGVGGLIESADSSDNDTTNAEFSRLTDLLQARGLPTHIVNAFGSKVQQFLHRTMSSGITSRSSQLVHSLQQHDESVKLTALSELCQLLVMGNEETLVGFPIKQAVPLLLQCMRSESENYDLMNHACRALTYMMESLPRSSSIIAEGIGVFLEKLQVIQCMDVAEQSLTALEILSRRHSKQILNATQSGSISACLTYIDFFSIAAQRNALQITANCCQNVIKDEFVHIQSSLPILSQRLVHSDKKSVESVCTVFARLVENFQRDRVILKEIASHNVLTNMQQLLVAQPSVISPSIFVTVLHTIYLMCANCNELAIELLENNIANTFKQLLIGSKFDQTTPTSTNLNLKELQLNNQQETIEILSSRSPQELYEIVSIIGEIMPRLPQTGIFAIDEILRKTSLANQNEHVIWQWKDERDVWRPYTPVDSRIIESAFSQEEDECVLNTMGRTYVLDFNSMLQINEDTGTTRPIARKVLNQSSTSQVTTTHLSSNNVNTNNTTTSTTAAATVEVATNDKNESKDEDNRLIYLEKNPHVYAQFVSSLFSILYEVYNSSAGPAIKHRSLRAILRMIFYSNNSTNDKNNNSENNNATTSTSSHSVLYNLLKTLPISSHIASMLASTDPKIIVSALQMCEILMQKMPDVFAVYFHREGVIHQIDKLIEIGASSTQIDASNATNNNIKSEQETNANSLDSNQRKTRSSTAAAAAAAAAAIAANTGVTTNSNAVSASTSSNESNSNAKRKVRSSGQSSKNSTGLFASNNTTSDSTSNQPSLTSSTSKYFRNIITKMHGGNSSSSSSSNSNNTNNAQTNKPSGQSPFQSFSLLTPNASRLPTSNTFSSHNYLSQTSNSQRNSSTNEFSLYARNDPSVSSGSLWNQLKSSTSSTNQTNSYSNLIPLSTTSTSSSSSRRKTYNPIQSQIAMNPLVSLQQNNQPPPPAQPISSIDYNLINQNKEKVRQWIYEQAKRFKQTYFSTPVSSSSETTLVDPTEMSNSGLNVLKRLREVVQQLDLSLVQNLFNETNKSVNFDNVNSTYLVTLKEISNILNETDISSFEMIHSGLIQKLGSFLSIHDDMNLEKKYQQLTRPVHYQLLHSTFKPVYLNDMDLLIKNEFKTLRCKQFLNVFSNLPITFFNGDLAEVNNKNTTISLFSILLLKLHNCVNQLEQFAVKVHDVPTSVGYGKTAAIKFFNTHQFKCLLRRHPTCSTTTTSKSSKQKTTYSTVSQWKGGPVKVDPLAVVSTIEKYLICRGLHRPSIQQSNTATSSGFLSSSLPTSSMTHKSKSTKSKSPSSRLFMFKSSDSDRFKARKSKSQTAAKSTSKSPTKRASKSKTSDGKITKVNERTKLKSKPKKSKSVNSSAASSVASSSTAAATSTSSKPTNIEKKSSSKGKSSKMCDFKSKSFSNAQDLIEENEELDEDEEQDDEFGDLVEESIDNDEYDFNEDVDITHDDNEQVLELEDGEDDLEHEEEEDDDENEDEELDETYENQIAEEEIEGDEDGEEESEDNELDEDDEDEEDDEDDDEDDDDDNDIESAMNAILGSNSTRSGATSSGSFKNFYLSSLTSSSSTPLPKFELLINDHVLPSNMSIYQAIKLYSMNNGSNSNRNDDLDNDTESSLLNSAIWSKVHTIHYRLAQPNTTTTATNNTQTSKTETTETKRTTRTTKAKKSKSKSKGTASNDLDASGSDILDSEEDTSTPLNANKNISSTVFFNTLSTKCASATSSPHDQSMDAISLLRLLNTLNRDWYLMYHEMYTSDSLLNTIDSSQAMQPLFLIGSEQFVNTKLTAKANRQLQDPLVIMTGHLPRWLPELMKTWPFLFPFKTRLMYFYVASLDRDRAMQKLIDMNSDLFQHDTTSANPNHTDRFVPKLEKKKRTIVRANDLIKQADTILTEFAQNNMGTTSSGASSYSHKPALLEIQYENEVGTGLGPTLEFYALVSLEVQKCENEMWRGEKMSLTSTQNQNQLYFFSPNGLFPAPVSSLGKQTAKQTASLTKLKSRFKFLGKFFAKAIMDFRVVDIQLSYAFYKWLIDPNSLCTDDIKYIDSQLYKSIESLKDYLRKRRLLLAQAYKLKSNNVENDLKPVLNELSELEKTVLDLDLDFTLPGYSHIELKKGGKDTIVNLENLEEYIKLIVDWTLITGVEKQLEAFREGFESILSISCLQQFYPEELERLFCGSSYQEWTTKLLNECTRCDHGFTHESTAVKYLFEIMCSFNSDEQRQFLQFITGSPRLPVGGLRSLVPPLTIVRKSVEAVASSTSSSSSADQYLPSVMTCVNYLKLPDYSSIDIMKEKLFKAMKDGQLSFHLS